VEVQAKTKEARDSQPGKDHRQPFESGCVDANWRPGGLPATGTQTTRREGDPYSAARFDHRFGSV